MNINGFLNDLNTIREGIAAEQAAGKESKISPDSIDIAEMTVRNLNGDYTHGRTTIQEALTSTDTVQLIPRVIEGQMREAAEPEYLATNFMQKITVDKGNSVTYVIPVAGEIHASEVGEGGRYNEQTVDFNTIENSQLEVRVKKIGCKVSITEEAITDSSWDIYGMNVRKMGRAMARYKEEWIFQQFSTHGHTVFDNNLRSQNEAYGTTGRDVDGSFNDTMSVEDFLDLVLVLMSNGFNPTDVIMHPLTWVVFARNTMLGNGLTYGAFNGQYVHPNNMVQGTPAAFGLANNGANQPLIVSPDQVQNRLPMPLAINLSPYIKFDKVNRKFDMYCIDRGEVGVIVEKEALTTDNWSDPEKDIRNLKCKERYGVGILNNGLAITVCKNLAVAATYPTPPVVKVQSEQV